MIYSFKFRYGGRSMFGHYNKERNTLEIGRSCRGNKIVDVITVDWCFREPEKLSLISSLDSDFDFMRRSARKYFYQVWRINLMFNR